MPNLVTLRSDIFKMLGFSIFTKIQRTPAFPLVLALKKLPSPSAGTLPPCCMGRWFMCRKGHLCRSALLWKGAYLQGAARTH